MSRAFVNEDAGTGDEDLPERPVSDHPNFVTPSGLRQLQDQLAGLESRRVELLEAASSRDEQEAAVAGDELRYVDRDLRYVERRIASAMPVEPAGQPRGVVAFGATVTARDRAGELHTYTIVGEDEADPESGKVSHVSPLAKALMGARIAQAVTWHRPAGDLRLLIERIEYL